MSINLEKHRNSIISAWNEVIDDKIQTDWALFGYEGQTNNLKLVSKGNFGLDELLDELNTGKIMYAFVRIPDKITGLVKFILINWQGEGAPLLRKGTCANHLHEVTKILKGAHLTINARIEDDIDKERIIKQLNTTTSSYSINKESIQTLPNEPQEPIGTNYNRVIPAKELNPTEMQKFWKNEEIEEKARQDLEKERKRLEMMKIEEEQRTREEKEYHEREKKSIYKNQSQSGYIPVKTSPQPLSPNKSIENDNRTMMTAAEQMRQQRKQEAREIIGSRVGAAKAIFVQNVSDGQFHNQNPPLKPMKNSITRRINELNNSNINEMKKSLDNDMKLSHKKNNRD